ncbi:GNAT family N-acetyltransferase [Myxococcota bacterium]|nr:GNAT family N-acetyltransferase [Myxococcota bacterium]MBU1536211.1 GNAT family N-acetyltransferase [Myxococcota bacterium]
MPAVLFEASGFTARQLELAQVPMMQNLFERNPEYFLVVNGAVPGPDEALNEFNEIPPPHLSYSEQWCIGIFTPEQRLAGVATVVSDLGAIGVWHTGLFLLATYLHGLGHGASLYRALEAWAQTRGAQWMRLGVVKGNVKGERFWEKMNFTAVRSRTAADASGHINDVRVMVKPMGRGSLEEYFSLAPRDDPSSELL